MMRFIRPGTILERFLSRPLRPSDTQCSTLIVLLHSGWEKLSANAQKTSDSYNQGWQTVFVTDYREYAQNRKQFRDE